jgi:hypothetical protein
MAPRRFFSALLRVTVPQLRIVDLSAGVAALARQVGFFHLGPVPRALLVFGVNLVADPEIEPPYRVMKVIRITRIFATCVRQPP